MKKILVLFLILAGIAVGALVLSSRNTGMGVITGSSKDVKFLETQSLKFLEDLKFKDFQKAASYHSAEDRKTVNIPALIERMFAVKPETLDIMRYEVQKVEIDSSGLRARVKTKTVFKVLNANDIREPEIMLYWFKDPTEGWVMELESSLR
jgi:hypothetical protein